MNGLLQLVSILGATMILLAYFALQRRWWSSHTWPYLWCNFLGATLLTVVAVADRRIGFIALEAVWALVTLQTMVSLRNRRAGTGEDGPAVG
jgi:hypothetical protein